MAQTSGRFWWACVLHFLNLSSTSSWDVYSHNMHPSSTIMLAFTLITISFPEALVHILNHVTSTHSVSNVYVIFLYSVIILSSCVSVNVNVCVCVRAVCHYSNIFFFSKHFVFSLLCKMHIIPIHYSFTCS